jgi:hypothetical protein
MRTQFHALRPSGRLAGDVHRALVATGMMVGICAVGAAFAGLAHTSMSRGAQPHTLTAAELNTGSLLVVSPSGTFCRNRTIDNATWRIRDNGWVDCEDALAKSTGTATTGARFDLIRQSFRGN